MEVVLKTLLYLYPSLKYNKDGLERLANRKALRSCCDNSKTMQQINEIIKINGQIRKIEELEECVNLLLDHLSNEERIAISYKYFNKSLKGISEFSLRSYYRYLKRAFDKLLIVAKEKDLSPFWLKSNYGDIYFISFTYRKLLKKSELEKQSLPAAQ